MTNLVLLGDGPHITRKLPKHTVWRPGSFRYGDVIGHHRGGQGIGRALPARVTERRTGAVDAIGVTPIVSPVGALPEFQPPGCEPVGVDDVDGLAAAFDALG